MGPNSRDFRHLEPTAHRSHYLSATCLLRSASCPQVGRKVSRPGSEPRQRPREAKFRFGAFGGDALAMSTSAPYLKVKALGLQASRDPKRSPLFHWLREKHDTLAPLLAGRRVDWEPVIAAMRKAGITDYGGGVPTEHTLRRT